MFKFLEGSYDIINLTFSLFKLLSLMPLLSNLAVSTTNTVNLMFNSIKMAEATN